jgi:hypothetical protein
MYITLEEFKILSGEDVTLYDLILLNSKFKSVIHPNAYMVEEFKRKHGTYPLEIKLAMKEYIQYTSKNKHIFSQIPMSSSVGNTSITYSPYLQKNFNRSFLRACPDVREILTPTNVLNGYAYNKKLPFIGTVFNIEPYVEEQKVNKKKPQKQSAFIPMENILGNLPTCVAEIYRKNYKMNGSIRTDVVDYDYSGELMGNLKLHEFDNKIRATLYIPNTYLGGDKVEVVLEDRVKVYTDDTEYTYTVLGITKASDDNKTHHYELDMS